MEYEIIGNIKTLDSAEVLKQELEVLLNSLYSGKEEFESVLRTKVRSSFADFIRRKISQEDVRIDLFLKDFIKKLDSVPVVKLILAFEPSEETVNRIYSYIVSACKREVFLDLGYSPDIIGGAIIIYRGKYKDLSFKYVFEREFEEEKKKILEFMKI